MRKLIVVPTLHDFSETRGLASNPNIGLNLSMQPIIKSTNVYWNSVDKAIMEARFDFPNLKVFAETLTVNEPMRTLDILPFDEAFKYADTLLSEGELSGRQERLALTLYNAGAQMMPTENAQLFSQALEAADDVVNSKPSEENESDKLATNKLSVINIRRDEFVSSMIEKYLGEGETGLVIMGMAHDVTSKLPEDIIIDFICPDAREFWDETHGEGKIEILEAHYKFLAKREGQVDKEIN